MEMRHLRNQMVREYIEDMATLSSDLGNGTAIAPSLISAARQCSKDVQRALPLDAAARPRNCCQLASTRIAQTGRNAIDRDMNAALDFFVGLAFAVAAHQLNLQVVQRIDIWKAVADRALQ